MLGLLLTLDGRYVFSAILNRAGYRALHAEFAERRKKNTEYMPFWRLEYDVFHGIRGIQVEYVRNTGRWEVIWNTWNYGLRVLFKPLILHYPRVFFYPDLSVRAPVLGHHSMGAGHTW
jgi:hypothetical protein